MISMIEILNIIIQTLYAIIEVEKILEGEVDELVDITQKVNTYRMNLAKRRPAGSK